MADVALRFDAGTLHAMVGDDRYRAAGRYLATDAVFDVVADDGGATGAVEEDDHVLEVWIGIVNGGLVTACDGDSCPPGQPCAHAVAVALAGFEEGIAFSSVSAPPARLVPHADQEEYARFAERLTRRQLVDLVSSRAATDRHFAVRLMARARALPAPGPRELGEARRIVGVIRDITAADEWGYHDFLAAGQSIVDELGILVAHPATRELLDVLEDAIRAWAAMVDHINDAWLGSETEPEEIASALADLHLQVTEQLGLPSAELAGRLAGLRVEPDAYVHLLEGSDLTAPR